MATGTRAIPRNYVETSAAVEHCDARGKSSASSSCGVVRMSSKLCFLVCMTATTVFTACLYLLAVYNDRNIQFIRTYMLPEMDGDFATTDAASAGTADPRIARARKLRESGVKTVLLWNSLFGERNFFFGEGDIFRGCPVNSCKFSNDRDYLHVEDFDAVLFHGNEMDVREVPARRRTGQFYVYVNLESPANRDVPRAFENYFNLTMTYRLDSDVPWTYGVMQDVGSGEYVAPSKDADWSAVRNGMTTLISRYFPSIFRGMWELCRIII